MRLSSILPSESFTRRISVSTAWRFALALPVVLCGAMFIVVGTAAVLMPSRPEAHPVGAVVLGAAMLLWGASFLFIAFRLARPLQGRWGLLGPVARQIAGVLSGALAVLGVIAAWQVRPAFAFPAVALACCAATLIASGRAERRRR